MAFELKPSGVRHQARILATQALHTADAGNVPIRDAIANAFDVWWESLLEELSREVPEEGGEDPIERAAHLRPLIESYARQLAEGTWNGRLMLDGRIGKHLHRFAIDRLAVVDRNVLRWATWELDHVPFVPPAVTINEAIEIVKLYSTAESGKFVNGVLASLLQKSAKRSWDRTQSPEDPLLPEFEQIAQATPAPVEVEEIEAGTEEAKVVQRYGWVLRSGDREIPPVSREAFPEPSLELGPLAHLRAIIFDFDGLILDTESAEVETWREVFDEYGCEFPDSYWQNAIGRGADQLTEWPEDILCRLRPELNPREQHERTRARIMARIEADRPRMGIVELLDEAREAGLRLAVASSSQHGWVDAHLKRLGLYDRFEVIVCRDDVNRAKPFPDLYLLALEKLNLAPTEAFAMEDSPNGVMAAIEAGLKVVAYPNPMTAGLDLSRATTVVEAGDLDLPTLRARLS